MSKTPKTAREWAESIPEDMRGHVFHELGVMGHAAHSGGGIQPQSGGNGPPPTKPKPPEQNPDG